MPATETMPTSRPQPFSCMAEINGEKVAAIRVENAFENFKVFAAFSQRTGRHASIGDDDVGGSCFEDKLGPSSLQSVHISDVKWKAINLLGFVRLK